GWELSGCSRLWVQLPVRDRQDGALSSSRRALATDPILLIEFVKLPLESFGRLEHLDLEAVLVVCFLEFLERGPIAGGVIPERVPHGDVGQELRVGLRNRVAADEMSLRQDDVNDLVVRVSDNRNHGVGRIPAFSALQKVVEWPNVLQERIDGAVELG